MNRHMYRSAKHKCVLLYITEADILGCWASSCRRSVQHATHPCNLFCVQVVYPHWDMAEVSLSSWISI